MFKSLVNTASGWLTSLQRRLAPSSQSRSPATSVGIAGDPYERLTRILLTEGVRRTLFDEFAAHRTSGRRDEETGWVLVGYRDRDLAEAVGVIPAGTARNAGAAHVQFCSDTQAVAARILRQLDKRLTILGVVHTHPGSLRQPSDGDYQGDRKWVCALRGSEGVFGIGTADGAREGVDMANHLIKAHVQAAGDLVFSWYALGDDDAAYRPLKFELTPGHDLGLRLRGIWGTIEAFAAPLERLCVQQAGTSLQVVEGQTGETLAACFKLATPQNALRVVLKGTDAAYYWQRGEELRAIESPAQQLDRGVYLVLADISQQG